MANIHVQEMPQARFSASAPYGNLTRSQIPMETNASGVLIGGDRNAALAIGDKVYLKLFPRGTLIGLKTDVPVSDAFTAATTLKLGFEYADGIDSADFPQDDAFFLAASSTAAVARLDTTPAVKPQVLPKDAWLIGTIAGANHASAGRLDILLDTQFLGASAIE